MVHLINFLLWPANLIRRFIHRLYAWSESFAAKPQSEKYLAVLSFAESSFFPIPPDPLLLACIFTRPIRWKRFIIITIVASVMGGVFGYLIGQIMIESVGQWLLDTYHLHDQFDKLGQSYTNNAFFTVLSAALTPIPYKIITISAGAFKVNFFSFVAASVLGRGLRFTAGGLLAKYLGTNHKDKIVNYIDLISLAIVTILLIIILFR